MSTIETGRPLENAEGSHDPLAVPADRYGMKIDPPKPLLQSHIEDFQEGLRKRTQDKPCAAATIRGYAVRVAVGLGWITGLDAQDVKHLQAGKVSWAYAVLAKYLEEQQEAPPN